MQGLHGKMSKGDLGFFILLLFVYIKIRVSVNTLLRRVVVLCPKNIVTWLLITWLLLLSIYHPDYNTGLHMEQMNYKWIQASRKKKESEDIGKSFEPSPRNLPK